MAESRAVKVKVKCVLEGPFPACWNVLCLNESRAAMVHDGSGTDQSPGENLWNHTISDC